MSEPTPVTPAQGSPRTILWLTALGSVLGMIIVVLVFGWRGQSAAEKIAERHLKKAEERSQQAIDQQLQHLNRFFKHAKDGVPDFAAAALGFYSKFRLIWDHMPFTDRDGHKKFLQSKFEEHVFSRQQLEQCIEQVIHLYLQEIRSIENKMLVDLQADLADLSSESPLTQYNHQQLWQKFEQEMLNQIRKSTSTHLKLDLTREVVSVIAAEALSKVVTRLGVSAGILGFGATSGWATLGVGLVVAFIIDQIWEWWTDPKGNLTQELNGHLDKLHAELVRELRDQLTKFAQERAAVRHAAVQSLLRPQREDQR